MSLASDVNAARLKHLYLSPETPASIGRKFRFLHIQRISIGKRSISIRTLCSMFLFRKKAAGGGVSKKAVLLSFCCKINGWCFALYPCEQLEPVRFRRLPGCLHGCKVIQNRERRMLLWNNSYFCNLENVWAACRFACLRRRRESARL